MLRITGSLRDHRAEQESSALAWVEAHWMTKATEAELQEAVDAWMDAHKVAPRPEDIALALYENEHGHPPLVD